MDEFRLSRRPPSQERRPGGALSATGLSAAAPQRPPPSLPLSLSSFSARPPSGVVSRVPPSGVVTLSTEERRAGFAGAACRGPLERTGAFAASATSAHAHATSPVKIPASLTYSSAALRTPSSAASRGAAGASQTGTGGARGAATPQLRLEPAKPWASFQRTQQEKGCRLAEETRTSLRETDTAADRCDSLARPLESAAQPLPASARALLQRPSSISSSCASDAGSSPSSSASSGFAQAPGSASAGGGADSLGGAQRAWASSARATRRICENAFSSSSSPSCLPSSNSSTASGARLPEAPRSGGAVTLQYDSLQSGAGACGAAPSRASHPPSAPLDVGLTSLSSSSASLSSFSAASPPPRSHPLSAFTSACRSIAPSSLSSPATLGASAPPFRPLLPLASAAPLSASAAFEEARARSLETTSARVRTEADADRKQTEITREEARGNRAREEAFETHCDKRMREEGDASRDVTERKTREISAERDEAKWLHVDVVEGGSSTGRDVKTGEEDTRGDTESDKKEPRGDTCEGAEDVFPLHSKIFGRLSGEQRKVVLAPPDANLCVIAGPGSGKTSAIAARIIRLLLLNRGPVLALTFTKRGADELRERVLAGLSATLEELRLAHEAREDAKTSPLQWETKNEAGRTRGREADRSIFSCPAVDVAGSEASLESSRYPPSVLPFASVFRKPHSTKPSAAPALAYSSAACALFPSTSSSAAPFPVSSGTLSRPLPAPAASAPELPSARPSRGSSGLPLFSDLAGRVFVGTFHKFGTLLLRRYGRAVGVASSFLIATTSRQTQLARTVLEAFKEREEAEEKFGKDPEKLWRKKEAGGRGGGGTASRSLEATFQQLRRSHLVKMQRAAEEKQRERKRAQLLAAQRPEDLAIGAQPRREDEAEALDAFEEEDEFLDFLADDEEEEDDAAVGGLVGGARRETDCGDVSSREKKRRFGASKTDAGRGHAASSAFSASSFFDCPGGPAGDCGSRRAKTTWKEVDMFLRLVRKAKFSETFRDTLKTENASLFELTRQYGELLRRQQPPLLDYADLILQTLRLLEGHGETRREVGTNFPIVFVDEFQDTSLSQFKIVKALARGRREAEATDEGRAEAAQPHRAPSDPGDVAVPASSVKRERGEGTPTPRPKRTGGVTVVGDDDQSIYGFRGIDAKNFCMFGRAFPNRLELHLSCNYRSVAPIVSTSLALISQNRQRRLKRLHPAACASALAFFAAYLFRECPPAALSGATSAKPEDFSGAAAASGSSFKRASAGVGLAEAPAAAAPPPPSVSASSAASHLSPPSSSAGAARGLPDISAFPRPSSAPAGAASVVASAPSPAALALLPPVLCAVLASPKAEAAYILRFIVALKQARKLCWGDFVILCRTNRGLKELEDLLQDPQVLKTAFGASLVDGGPLPVVLASHPPGGAEARRDESVPRVSPLAPALWYRPERPPDPALLCPRWSSQAFPSALPLHSTALKGRGTQLLRKPQMLLVFAYLRLAVDVHHDASFLRALNQPKRGLGLAVVRALCAALESLEDRKPGADAETPDARRDAGGRPKRKRDAEEEGAEAAGAGKETLVSWDAKWREGPLEGIEHVRRAQGKGLGVFGHTDSSLEPRMFSLFEAACALTGFEPECDKPGGSASASPSRGASLRRRAKCPAAAHRKLREFLSQLVELRKAALRPSATAADVLLFVLKDMGLEAFLVGARDDGVASDAETQAANAKRKGGEKKTASSPDADAPAQDGVECESGASRAAEADSGPPSASGRPKKKPRKRKVAQDVGDAPEDRQTKTAREEARAGHAAVSLGALSLISHGKLDPVWALLRIAETYTPNAYQPTGLDCVTRLLKDTANERCRGEDAFSAQRRDTIFLSTIHQAKGLEWPVVVLAKAQEGHLPLSSDEGSSSFVPAHRPALASASSSSCASVSASIDAASTTWESLQREPGRRPPSAPSVSSCPAFSASAAAAAEAAQRRLQEARMRAASAEKERMEEKELEEERRLCYVALTRAKSQILVTASRTDKSGQSLRLSRFVVEAKACHFHPLSWQPPFEKGLLAAESGARALRKETKARREIDLAPLTKGAGATSGTRLEGESARKTHRDADGAREKEGKSPGRGAADGGRARGTLEPLPRGASLEFHGGDEGQIRLKEEQNRGANGMSDKREKHHAASDPPHAVDAESLAESCCMREGSPEHANDLQALRPAALSGKVSTASSGARASFPSSAGCLAAAASCRRSPASSPSASPPAPPLLPFEAPCRLPSASLPPCPELPASASLEELSPRAQSSSAPSAASFLGAASSSSFSPTPPCDAALPVSSAPPFASAAVPPVGLGQLSAPTLRPDASSEPVAGDSPSSSPSSPSHRSSLPACVDASPLLRASAPDETSSGERPLFSPSRRFAWRSASGDGGSEGGCEVGVPKNSEKLLENAICGRLKNSVERGDVEPLLAALAEAGNPSAEESEDDSSATDAEIDAEKFESSGEEHPEGTCAAWNYEHEDCPLEDAGEAETKAGALTRCDSENEVDITVVELDDDEVEGEEVAEACCGSGGGETKEGWQEARESLATSQAAEIVVVEANACEAEKDDDEVDAEETRKDETAGRHATAGEVAGFAQAESGLASAERGREYQEKKEKKTLNDADWRQGAEMGARSEIQAQRRRERRAEKTRNEARGAHAKDVFTDVQKEAEPEVISIDEDDEAQATETTEERTTMAAPSESVQRERRAGLTSQEPNARDHSSAAPGDDFEKGRRRDRESSSRSESGARMREEGFEDDRDDRAQGESESFDDSHEDVSLKRDSKSKVRFADASELARHSTRALASPGRLAATQRTKLPSSSDSDPAAPLAPPLSSPSSSESPAPAEASSALEQASCLAGAAAPSLSEALPSRVGGSAPGGRPWRRFLLKKK
ncbi:hypothetical protein BESB_028350 [Besnoitia besnoiti]|uniref:DNA 3'-5' helicase n=1 Tax=Besnoitia besnoiti TaxID=94643 RepID=A0A2A9M7M8_BESBE|nr:uncharacterized protein BESB_028350 [Besnoitia besnoiti]PFH31400.1 hypothetical protein BESB_028350 [Besnoitia besnoiti]